jgi:hypothetical protein
VIKLDGEDVKHYSRVALVAGLAIIVIASLLGACGFVIWDASQVPHR